MSAEHVSQGGAEKVECPICPERVHANHLADHIVKSHNDAQATLDTWGEGH